MILRHPYRDVTNERLNNSILLSKNNIADSKEDDDEVEFRFHNFKIIIQKYPGPENLKNKNDKPMRIDDERNSTDDDSVF
jgi:hypothetical protein